MELKVIKKVHVSFGDNHTVSITLLGNEGGPSYVRVNGSTIHVSDDRSEAWCLMKNIAVALLGGA